jgi:hypothetical protein
VDIGRSCIAHVGDLLGSWGSEVQLFELFVLDMGESVRIMKANEEFLPWPQYN